MRKKSELEASAPSPANYLAELAAHTERLRAFDPISQLRRIGDAISRLPVDYDGAPLAPGMRVMETSSTRSGNIVAILSNGMVAVIFDFLTDAEHRTGDSLIILHPHETPPQHTGA